MVNEMKTSSEEQNSQFEVAEKKITKLEDRSTETTQFEEQKEKWKKKTNRHFKKTGAPSNLPTYTWRELRGKQQREYVKK